MTDKQWPRVKWNHDDLTRVAESLLIINPLGFSCAESLSSFIRGASERELYRLSDVCNISTGGWQVVFLPAYNHLRDQYDYVAIVSITPYTLHRYLQEKK
jgi:hypothetical protein